MGEERASRATAHSNIALIKYWGKRDADLVLPTTSSLSLTLDAYWTTTTVTVHDAAFTGLRQPSAAQSHPTEPHDTVILDGNVLEGPSRQRVVDFLDIIRQFAGSSAPATVVSENHVPTAAGLASSASAFAALAAAASDAYGLKLSPRDVSRLARRGSGSATRSVFGAFAIWHRGEDDATSFAEPLDSPLTDDVAMVAAVVNSQQKSVSSREGMRRTVASSPVYDAWVASHAGDLRQALAAVHSGDFDALGEVTEANAMGMHATMHTARPPVMYWQPSTLNVLNAVWKLRADGVSAWATMDAGPNVKVLCRRKDEFFVQSALSDITGVVSCDIAHAGPGVRVENCRVEQAGADD